jgi:hypothetical protein
MTVVSNMSPLHYLILVNCDYSMLTLLDLAAERGLISNLPEVLDSLLNSTPFYAGKEVSKVVVDMKQRDFERKQRH